MTNIKGNMSVQTSDCRPELTVQCNRCLCELKPFQDVPTTGGNRPVKCFWSNCKHILCQTCRMHLTDQCSACNQKCQFIEISRKMPEQYQSYFESTLRLRKNLIGTVQFQQEQSTFITKRTIDQTGSIRSKCRELTQNLEVAKTTLQQKLTEQRKLMIIFEKICDEKKRYSHFINIHFIWTVSEWFIVMFIHLSISTVVQQHSKNENYANRNVKMHKRKIVTFYLLEHANMELNSMHTVKVSHQL